MRKSKLMAAVLIALSLGTAAVAGASPAAADSTWSGTVTDSSQEINATIPFNACTFIGGEGVLYAESTTFTPVVSGTYTFTVTSAVMNGHADPEATALSLYTPSFGEANCTYSVVGSGLVSLSNVSLVGGTTYVLLFWGSGAPGDAGTAANSSGPFTVSMPANSPASVAEAPAWVQAYGRHGQHVTCIVGWDPSWQEWAQRITGGWVCTRSVPSLGWTER